MFDPVFQIKNKGRKRRREEEISDSLIHSSFQQKEKREKQRERKERREIVPTRRKQHSVQYGMGWYSMVGHVPTADTLADRKQK